MIATFTIILFFLLLIGLPVAFSLGMGGVAGIFAFMGGTSEALSQVPIIGYQSIDDFVLTAVPLYILMSQILLEGKVGSNLFELANKWLRHLPGGLGVATIIACAIFAAITGSSVACAVTIGAIAIPEMLSRGYDRATVLGSVAAGGTLGILIPPSIPMILYSAITDESVGKLFMSGVLPGVLMTLMFTGIVVMRSRHLEREAAATWAERMDELKKSFWGLLLPVIVFGGIYSGIFTPTEAAAIAREAHMRAEAFEAARIAYVTQARTLRERRDSYIKMVVVSALAAVILSRLRGTVGALGFSISTGLVIWGVVDAVMLTNQIKVLDKRAADMVRARDAAARIAAEAQEL